MKCISMRVILEGHGLQARADAHPDPFISLVETDVMKINVSRHLQRLVDVHNKTHLQSGDEQMDIDSQLQSVSLNRFFPSLGWGARWWEKN